MLLNLTLQSLEFVHNDYRIKKKKKSLSCTNTHTTCSKNSETV